MWFKHGWAIALGFWVVVEHLGTKVSAAESCHCRAVSLSDWNHGHISQFRRPMLGCQTRQNLTRHLRVEDLFEHDPVRGGIKVIVPTRLQ